MMTHSVAIACQGGGSHTAFTAGVLQHLLEQRIQEQYNIVGFSGTSGGAVCALLAWYELAEASDTNGQRLIDFWMDNSSSLWWEQIGNMMVVNTMRSQQRGLLPNIASTPYSTVAGWLRDMLNEFSPRDEFVNFRTLLEKHIDFDRVQDLSDSHQARLLLGAVDVLSGDFKVFNSRKGEIQVEAVLASAALPTLFEAVPIGGTVYWDGLLSQNPPLLPFVDDGAPHERPDEIWVIQVNPVRREHIPESPDDITDRRNELMGNLSLHHEMRLITLMNRWIKQSSRFDWLWRNLKPVTVRCIQMSDELNGLDLSSKFDRAPDLIERLIDGGRTQAAAFLANTEEHTLIAA
ncbi:MAG: patatin-like phospholipase family protein [Chloroflexaceae bacterium]|nr:patatin-like phospholipase family protein [Chloroflexaceae bacterium]